ncbi:MAG: TerC family protein [Beijerinckiaceae bacterium]
MMDFINYAWPVLQIIGINIVLSGDNAVVIALACRSLPENQRNKAVIIGALAAVGLRIIFTFMTAQLLDLPWVKLIGGLLLFYIAIKLMIPEDEDPNIAAHDTLWKAIQTIAIADIVMSLDNVIAIAAAAKGNWNLILLGLAISIPLVIFGSQIIMKMMHRFPWLVWAGAALLGYVAAEIMIEDPLIASYFMSAIMHYGALVVGVGIVMAAGFYLMRKKLSVTHA